MNKILILTIGGSHQPIIKSINDNKPDYTVFICSDDLPTQKGSYTQIVDKVEVKKDGSKSYLPNIPVQANLKENSWEIRKIKFFDDLNECYKVSQCAINDMRQRFDNAEIIIDYTGGTKTMTAGLAAAALDDGDCKIVLVTGTRSDLNKVADKTEYVKPVAIYDTLANKAVQQAKELVKRYDFAGVLNIFNSIIKLQLSNEKAQEIRTCLDVCMAFDSWDRFDHAEAYQFLSPHRKNFVQFIDPLEEIKKEIENNNISYLFAEDLLLNAERRATQGRYEDAVGRLYRAIELIAQVRLKNRYGQETGDINISCLQDLPTDLKKKLEEKISSDNSKIMIGLKISYDLLTGLNDEIFKEWYTDNEKKIKDFLQYRNNSLFAHGFKPIFKSDYESHIRPVLESIRNLLAMIYKKEKIKNAKIIQFPDEFTGFYK